MSFKLINKRLLKNKFETSVLLFLRQDARVFKLLESLGKQEYKDFIVLIANDSKTPYLQDKDIPNNLSYIYYHSDEEKYSPYDKINFLADKIETKFAALTESDCEPGPRWLADLLPLARKSKNVIKGCEARPIGCCTANLVFPAEIIKKVKFDKDIPLIADYEWGMALEKAGYKIDYAGNGLVFHNTLTGKPRFNRIIPAARDEVYIAFKYKKPEFLIHKILRNGYNIFNGLCLTLLYILFVPYFFIKRLLSKGSFV